jgi:hypothetical protein
MTYVFAQSPDLLRRFLKDKIDDKIKTRRDRFNQKMKGDTKRSYLKLIEREYEGIIKKIVAEKRRLNPSDLADAAVSNDLVKKVVSFQRNRLSAIPEKYKKYSKYAIQKPLRTENPPMLIVPPYFYNANADWHRVNIDLAARTRSIVTDLPVFGMVFCSTEMIETSGDRIIEDFGRLKLDGFLLWVNDFDGRQGFRQLRVVRGFVKALAGLKKPVVSMYGDAFSLVLAYSGLTGYCCGICYAERKAADQDVDVEGGMPVRYYIERLKKKVQVKLEAPRIPLTKYQLGCNCEICNQHGNYSELDDANSREHFMLVRQAEIDSIRAGQSAEDFSNSLKSAYDRYKDEPDLSPLTHLSHWSKLLT